MSSGALLPSSDVHFFDSALSLMDRAFYCPDGLETLSSIPDVLTGEAPAAPPPKRKKVKARASKQMKAKPIGQRARDAYNPIYAKSALQAAIAKQKAREQKKEAENRRKGQPKVKLTKSEKRQARLQKLEARAEVKRQKRQAEKEERVMQEQANRLGVDLEMLQKHKRQLEAPTVISASEQMARLRGKLARKIEDMKARRRSEQSARDKKNKQQQRQKAKKRVRDASEAGDGEDEEESRPAKRSKRSSAAMDSGNESSDIEEDFQFAAIAQRKVDDLTALDGKKKRRKDSKKRELEKALAIREKLQKLKETDPERAKELEHKHAVKAALLRSQGVVVKDNPALIKKSLKQKERQKKKSAKQWKEREKLVKKSIKERQHARQANIDSRIREKKNRKLLKKGIVPTNS